MRRILSTTLLGLLAGSCGSPPAAEHEPADATIAREASPAATDRESPAAPPDAGSQAQPGRVGIHHVDLELTVDCARRALDGRAELHLVRVDSAAPLILDAAPSLDVIAVTGADASPRRWRRVGADRAAGLQIDLLDGDDTVAIAWRVAADSAAVHWLAPEQTASGEPLLYVTGDRRHARAWLPIQDTPAARSTWSVEIRTDPGQVALLAASTSRRVLPGVGQHRFQIEQRVPARGLALVVGHLARQDAGPRIRVWSEPGQSELARSVGEDAQTLGWIAEARFGPMDRARLDLVVLPPTFAGAMTARPGLALLSRSICPNGRSGTEDAPPEGASGFDVPPLAYSASLCRFVASHHGSHLVAPASWRDLDLALGIDRFLADRLLRASRGAAAVADNAFAEASLLLPPPRRREVPGARRQDSHGLPHQHGALRYATMLRDLERDLGTARLEDLLSAWRDRFRDRSASTEHFRWLLSGGAVAGAATDRLDEWLGSHGAPADWSPPVQSARRVASVRAALEFAGGASTKALLEGRWTRDERLAQLEALAAFDLPAARWQELDSAYGLSATDDVELLAAWLRCRLITASEPLASSLTNRLTELLAEQGATDLLLPLYDALQNAPGGGRARAVRIYQSARLGYHPRTRAALDALLFAQDHVAHGR